ncbi:phosphoribosylglycinamide formyltransferase [Fluviicola taffensis]|uniref:phosphoribosylglycinamide formyltransferase 1 n=1 Tax=Fluviicola taffensis (strain DSM 16823 / NCIMB 13979 / RW262) TaxID=755732 RepID=F2IJ26_FLUTR|nr:phosphoribosylglycinamide formyltransferase [Fluviicola taffensis]AEA43884.1 Phosphoribosylglycinamide formyltransferase [Fluviicola taffensis DSM 16823]
MNKKSIALFASGNGSNAINLIHFFQNHPKIEVKTLLCNRENAPIVEKAKSLGIEVLLFSNEEFESGLTVLQELDYRAIDWIILAGFLRKIPVNIIRGYHNRIVNIHPSLLPKFGGQGMYGKFVHEAVIDAKESKSGISIHLVDEEFDKGKVLAQFDTLIEEKDTPENLAEKIQLLEHKHFPIIVEQTILNN